jgi:predicted DNA-binding transcriptional regulator AlpA
MEKMSNFNIMEDNLLTVEQICEKLSISRSTLDRWRGIGNSSLPRNTILDSVNELLGSKTNDEPIIPFPKPTLNIGRSPRWSANEINKWIKKLQDGKK